MLKRLSRFILYKWLGWKTEVTIDLPPRCIVCLAPHTSNWDFILGQAYACAEGLKIGFLMKEEWFFFPLGWFFKRLGGIPVTRKKHTSLTETLAEKATTSDTFHLCVTPEGTRRKTAEWRKGFYYIALKANIPILLYAADYEKKLIRCTKQIIPNGDFDAQMKEIKQYYKDYKGKYPDSFTVGDDI